MLCPPLLPGKYSLNDDGYFAKAIEVVELIKTSKRGWQNFNIFQACRKVIGFWFVYVAKEASGLFVANVNKKAPRIQCHTKDHPSDAKCVAPRIVSSTPHRWAVS